MYCWVLQRPLSLCPCSLDGFRLLLLNPILRPILSPQPDFPSVLFSFLSPKLPSVSFSPPQFHFPSASSFPQSHSLYSPLISQPHSLSLAPFCLLSRFSLSTIFLQPHSPLSVLTPLSTILSSLTPVLPSALSSTPSPSAVFPQPPLRFVFPPLPHSLSLVLFSLKSILPQPCFHSLSSVLLLSAPFPHTPLLKQLSQHLVLLNSQQPPPGLQFCQPS